MKEKIISIMLLFAIMAAMISGCGSRQVIVEGTENTEGNLNAGNTGGGVSKDSDENVAMGRYVEETTDLSDKITGYNSTIFKLSDGTLVITDIYGDTIVSKDNGVTWEVDKQEWRTKLLIDETYIFDMKVGSDGTVYVVYSVDDEETSEEENALEIHTRLMIVKPDGTQQFVETPVDGSYMNNVWISDNGRVFITILSESIYEVKEDGTCEKFLAIDGGTPYLIQFLGNLMILGGYEECLIYDMDKKTYVEDQVLEDFISETYKTKAEGLYSYDYGIISYDLFFFPGEDGTLYMANAKGLYRHVIGGSAIEQIIDGNLGTLSNPSVSLMGIIPLENNEFLALFTGGKLVRFTYDPDVPTLPSENLKIYSLRENDLVRQAVSLYQAENPTVYVEYETGMEENSSITREDALKNLNTKIMSGNGPDILILDNMPADTYINKGLLSDLTPILNNMEGEDALFANITDSFKQDGKIYIVPCEIQLPVIYGREKYISQMNDLASMADVIEELRTDNPEKDLFSICSEVGIMRMFAMSCVPVWKTDNNEINKENIADFLMQAKKIYDAQMEGLPDQFIEQWNNNNDYYADMTGETWEKSEIFRQEIDGVNYIDGSSQMLIGSLTSPYNYAILCSISQISDFKDGRLISMPGQSQDVFYAKTMAGISAVSENTSRAEDFLRLFLGKENQVSTFSGFPINKAAFEESFVLDESQVNEDGLYGRLGKSDREGNLVVMNIYWPNNEQIDALRKWMESVNTPYIEDTLLEYAVYEEGTGYMLGEQSLEEAVAMIEEKTALYMAE